MTDLMRRKHQRCAKDRAITYTFMNKAERYQAIARNHSRFGLYFESHRSLVPGTLIVIQNSTSDTKNSRNTEADSKFTVTGPSGACQELKTQVVGEVKRCEKIKEAAKSRYGIAVRYISPAA